MHRTILNGFKWTVVQTDDIGRNVLEGNTGNPKISYYIQRFLKPGYNIIDAGACFGWRTLEMARNVGTTGIVHAYEPHNGNLTLLTTNVHENNLEGIVKIHRNALGNRSMETAVWCAFHPNKENWGTSHISPLLESAPSDINVPGETNAGVPINKQIVSCKTIDEIHRHDHIHFILIDVQGFEQFVIEGAEETIGRCRPIMIVTINDDALSIFGCSEKSLSGMLKGMGYNTISFGLEHLCVPAELMESI